MSSSLRDIFFLFREMTNCSKLFQLAVQPARCLNNRNVDGCAHGLTTAASFKKWGWRLFWGFAFLWLYFPFYQGEKENLFFKFVYAVAEQDNKIWLVFCDSFLDFELKIKTPFVFLFLTSVSEMKIELPKCTRTPISSNHVINSKLWSCYFCFDFSYCIL